jgi:gamma-glutamyltranspeptidase/glutathione hydrolase
MLHERLAAALASAVLITAAAAPMPAEAQSTLLDYDTIKHPVVDREGMVVSQNEIASHVGAEILARGGNAVDAAVATAMALAVTLPRAGNIGGSGFMLVHIAGEDRTIAIDYRSAAPASATKEMFLDRRGRENRAADFGHRAAAVPGTVAGLALAHERYGSLPWAELVRPAQALAAEGIVVSRDLSEALRWGRSRLESSDAAIDTFFKADGTPYMFGEVLVQPELAWTLGRLADQGPEDFYTGEIARRIVADMEARGGLITLEDLAGYEAKVREPLRTTYRGLDVLTMPPSSSGGVALIEMLNILEHFDLAGMGPNSAASLHTLSEVMKLAYADRTRYWGDPDFVENPVTGVTSKAYAAERARLVPFDRATPPPEIAPGDPLAYESPDTTHFSVVDRHGNVVSNTYTLGSSFGSGAVVDGAGFLLDNQMKNFALRYQVPDVRGMSANEANRLEPGKRMTSSMTPTIVFREGEPWLVTGTPGGSTIINTVLQVIVNVVDHGMNIAEATEAPRIHQNWRPSELEVEPGISIDTLRMLGGLGHEIELSQTIGSAQSILIEDGELRGAADPRRPDSRAVGVENLRVLAPEQR